MSPRTSSLLFILAAVSTLFSISSKAEQSQQWAADSASYSDWEEKERKCGSWGPDKMDVDWGQPLRQSHTCMVTDFREKTTTEKNRYTHEIRIKHKKEETRLRQISEWRTTKGERDRLLTISVSEEWTAWSVDPSTLRDCQWLSPSLAEQSDLGVPMIRTRQCIGDASRRLPIHEHWLSGKTPRLFDQEKIEKSERKTFLAFTEIGKKDRWLEKNTKKTAWKKAGDTQCDSWPSIDSSLFETQWGTNVFVSRLCKRTLSRNVIEERKSLGGKKEILSTTKKTKQSSYREWRVNMGMRDDVINKQWHLAGDWKEKPESIVCVKDSFSESFPLDKVFTFYKKCDVTLMQRYSLIGTHVSGKTSIVEVRVDEKPSDLTMISIEPGEKDELLVADAQTRTSEWSNDGNKSCKGWFPLNITVNSGNVFLQSRYCEQNQQRHKESLSKWRSGDKWVVVDREFKGETFVETRNDVGVKRPSLTVEGLRLSHVDGNNASEKVSVAEVSIYNRLMVDVSSSKPNLSLVLNHQSGKIELPPLLNLKQTYFFNLDDYQIKEAGEWSLSLGKGALEDQDVVSITLKFQAID